jgi:hypothetical protein
VRTLFAITRDSNFRGEFPPVFPGTQRRYLAFFGGVNAFSPRIRGISARIPRNSSRTAAAIDAVRDRAFSGPPAAFRPRLSRPPPAASPVPPAWPYNLAGTPRGRGRGREGRSLGGREIHTREGYHKENKYRSSFAWRRLRLFYELCAYISLGVHAKVYSGHCLRIPRGRGYRCRQAGVKGYGIAGGKERPPVRLSRAGASSGGGRGDALAARCGCRLTAVRAGPGETALKMPPGPRPACGARDRPGRS